MRLRDLNWMDVAEYLERDNRIILVTGATEQHGYLSLLTDVRIPERIAEAAIGRENVLIAPPINFGVGTQFLDFPGTIGISESTFAALLTDIVHSLLQQGFSNILIINGHRGNRCPLALEELHEDSLIKLVWFDWWNSQAMRDFEDEHSLLFDHANWSENFAFNRVAPVPQLEKEPVIADGMGGMLMRESLGDGVLGGPYQLDDRLMFQLFDRVVNELVDLLIDLRD